MQEYNKFWNGRKKKSNSIQHGDSRTSILNRIALSSGFKAYDKMKIHLSKPNSEVEINFPRYMHPSDSPFQFLNDKILVGKKVDSNKDDSN